MNRAIRLSQVHAINWYGYSHASLPITGNTLFAGVTGSGKSVLMDLIMTVLVGTDVAHAHFNRSATGKQSARTLKSYCLLDTKREENGLPQYQRASGVTYIALEFTWPHVPGVEPRIETWGLRIEFRNTAEAHGKIDPFYCKGELTKDAFLAKRENDGKLVPRERSDFKRRLETDHEGSVFDTQDRYLRDMAYDTHLNFKRDVLNLLLPQAMSFTNSKSFDDFIRDFVLPTEEVKVDDVVTSYKNFMAYERDLRDLHDQLERLREISELSQARTNAERDTRIYEWLSVETEAEESTQTLSGLNERLRIDRAKHRTEQEQLMKLADEGQSASVKRDQLKNLIRESPGGSAYLFMKNEGERLRTTIDGLQGKKSAVDDDLRGLVSRARQWAGRVRERAVVDPMGLNTLDEAITHLDGCAASEHDSAFHQLNRALDQARMVLDDHLRPSRTAMQEGETKSRKLQEEISLLQKGHLSSPNILLNELSSALPRNGAKRTAVPLCLLCEVNDESWRAALEVAFDRKFAIVVEEANFPQALEIAKEFKRDAGSEPLVILDRAVKCLAKPGSLAEKLKAEDPIARSIIDQVFGEIICVENPDDILKHDKGITRDGFMVNGLFTYRPRHYDGLPFVGKRGLELQLSVKRTELRDLQAAMQMMKDRIAADVALQREMPVSLLGERELSKLLTEVQSLPALIADLDSKAALLKDIDRASFEAMDAECTVLDAQLKEIERQQLTLHRSKLGWEIEQLEASVTKAEERSKLASLRLRELSERVALSMDEVALATDYKADLIRGNPVQAEIPAALEKLSIKHAGVAEQKRTELQWKRTELGTHHKRHGELDVTEGSNAPWDRLLTMIESAEIPKYTKKANEQRHAWESLFRTQVLAKVEYALKGLADIRRLLNEQLKHPIGNDRYEIEAKPRPEFKSLRELIQLNALDQSDELFYTSVQGELRDQLDAFLKVLVEQPGSKEALRMLDYRCYFDYDLIVHNATDPNVKSQSVDKQRGKMSGGENQSPYFVAILASYLRAYKRHETRWKDPSLALVPIDEAFSKMDTGRIAQCIEAIKELGLQGVFSMSTGNIPGAFAECDQLVIVNRIERPRANGVHISNGHSCILKDSPEAREWLPDEQQAEPAHASTGE